MKMKTNYYPEMGDKRPESQMEAQIGHSGHWYCSTPLTLKGRGIKHLQTYKSEDLTPQGQRKVGWNSYRITQDAYKVLEKQYAISNECLL